MSRLITIAAFLGFLAPSLAVANHIDFVEDAPFAISVNGAGSDSIAVVGDPTNILGSEREVFLFGDQNGTSQASTVPSFSSSGLVTAIQASAGSDQVSVLELRYDGVGRAGLGGLDFATNWISIAINVSEVTSSWLAALEVSGGGGTGSAMATINAPGTYYFAFDDIEFTAVDFGSVDSLSAIFTALGPGASMTIESITREAVVPEPGTALLLSIGLMGLATKRARNARGSAAISGQSSRSKQ